MRNQRWIALIILAAFLPMATGCSKTRTVSMTDDPVDAQEQQELSGYTDRDGISHAWHGEVRAAGVDSLEFTRQGGDLLAYGPRPQVTLRLARGDVASLDLRVPDDFATFGLGSSSSA